MTMFRNRGPWYSRARWHFGRHPWSEETAVLKARSRERAVATIRAAFTRLDRSVIARLAAGDLPQREDVAHLPIRERNVVWHAAYGTEYDVSAAQFRALCREWLEDTEVASAA